MYIDNPKMLFTRMLDLSLLRDKSLEYFGISAFLFGPRMTGKTSLLKKISDVKLYYDLLDVELELRLKAHPAQFWQEIATCDNHDLVVVDEIQKCPELLSYVQKGIEEKGIQFILSGSSARKLRRGAANLLGGRALDLKLHPLTKAEMGDQFHLENALQFGTLPKISQLVLEKKTNVANDLLRSYVSTYLKQEIQAEALVRNLANFQRFLVVASQANAQMIEFNTIARDCGVPASTVKEYFTILEDTLLGRFSWPLNRSERKKIRPRFYFFDCGVVRAIQNRLQDPPTPYERGFLFETWFVGELHRINDYQKKNLDICLWRQERDEVDVVISYDEKPKLAFEVKTGTHLKDFLGIEHFRQKYPDTPIFIVSADDKVPRMIKDIKVIPIVEALELFHQLTMKS